MMLLFIGWLTKFNIVKLCGYVGLFTSVLITESDD